MARSRNIKPGFFTNDELAECQPLARILFAGLWTIADKEGRLMTALRKLKPWCCLLMMSIVTLCCSSCISTNSSIVTRKGDSYIQVSNWKKHQNPHCKEAASEIPEPSQNQNGTEQEQCNSNAKEEKEEEGKPQVLKIMKHKKSTVLVRCKNRLRTV
jgi:hypothetical protein